MKRRNFLATLGGVAAMPLIARAQPAMLTIGILQTGLATETNARDLNAFRQGLADHGLVEGQNIRIEQRSAGDRPDRLPSLATELVNAKVDAIYTIGGVAPTVAARNATSTIPIVFTHGSDPVRAGLVTSVNRPGGNVTGVSMFTGQITAKRLELLREVVPTAKIIAVLVNPKSATGETRISDVESAAHSLGLRIQVFEASSPTELDKAFTNLPQERADALFILADPLFRTHREIVLSQTNRLGVPAIHTDRDSVLAGGLMSYGARISEVIRQAGAYVGRILKGERPGDLPVLLPTKFELVINLRAAKMLGLAIPLTLQAAADEVIE